MHALLLISLKSASLGVAYGLLSVINDYACHFWKIAFGYFVRMLKFKLIQVIVFKNGFGGAGNRILGDSCHVILNGFCNMNLGILLQLVKFIEKIQGGLVGARAE